MLQLISSIREAGSECEDAADEFFVKGAKVTDFFPLETPDRLPVAVLEVEADPKRNVGWPGP